MKGWKDNSINILTSFFIGFQNWNKEFRAPFCLASRLSLSAFMWVSLKRTAWWVHTLSKVISRSVSVTFTAWASIFMSSACIGTWFHRPTSTSNVSCSAWCLYVLLLFLFPRASAHCLPWTFSAFYFVYLLRTRRSFFFPFRVIFLFSFRYLCLFYVNVLIYSLRDHFVFRWRVNK